MAKYLDLTGLRVFWTKVKDWVKSTAVTYDIGSNNTAKDLKVTGLNDLELRLNDDGEGSIMVLGNSPEQAQLNENGQKVYDDGTGAGSNIAIVSGDTVGIASKGVSLNLGKGDLSVRFTNYVNFMAGLVKRMSLSEAGLLYNLLAVEVSDYIKGGFGRLSSADTQISAAQIKLRASATNNITLTGTQNKIVGDTLLKDGVRSVSYTSSYTTTAIDDAKALAWIQGGGIDFTGSASVDDIASVRIIDIDEISAVLKINFNTLDSGTSVQLEDTNDNVVARSSCNLIGAGAALLFTVPTHTLATSCPVSYTVRYV